MHSTATYWLADHSTVSLGASLERGAVELEVVDADGSLLRVIMSPRQADALRSELHLALDELDAVSPRS